MYSVRGLELRKGSFSYLIHSRIPGAKEVIFTNQLYSSFFSRGKVRTFKNTLNYQLALINRITTN